MYEEFARGIIYDRMNQGGAYFTAYQMQEMAPMIAQMVDGHSVKELRDVRDTFRSVLNDEQDLDDVAVAEIWGYMVACEQLWAATDLDAESESDYAELAERFYRMAGI